MESCSVCSAPHRNPIPCLIGWMVFPQQRGMGFSGRRGGVGAWADTPKPPQGPGQQISLPCAPSLKWNLVYHNMFSQLCSYSVMRVHLSAAEVNQGGKSLREPKNTHDRIPVLLFVWFYVDNRLQSLAAEIAEQRQGEVSHRSCHASKHTHALVYLLRKWILLQLPVNGTLL